MIRIALFGVSFESDKEKELFLSSIEKAKKRAMMVAAVDVFVACNTRENNPGYSPSDMVGEREKRQESQTDRQVFTLKAQAAKIRVPVPMARHIIYQDII